MNGTVAKGRRMPRGKASTSRRRRDARPAARLERDRPRWSALQSLDFYDQFERSRKHGRQQENACQGEKAGIERAGEVAQEAHQIRPGKAADGAGRIDEGEAAGGTDAREEPRRYRPEDRPRRG